MQGSASCSDWARPTTGALMLRIRAQVVILIIATTRCLFVEVGVSQLRQGIVSLTAETSPQAGPQGVAYTRTYSGATRPAGHVFVLRVFQISICISASDPRRGGSMGCELD
eukprot:TRINITY_DN2488_c0_g1_i1.p5 TRINITY_DN2488_c0_g1~~TRINITY_DN2488_c0_g1_i1.p5  ORF type:complete len:111 (+),score=3.34 TRINITY_DN2488_c0_g1_i1:161-493(+)